MSNACYTSKSTHMSELENQLNDAESRCNNLKSQLDSMKRLYGTKRSQIVARNTSRNNPKTTSLVDVQRTKMTIQRQNSNAISTDNTGAAVETIHNILNGITESVNKISVIQSRKSTPRQFQQPITEIAFSTILSNSSSNEPNDHAATYISAVLHDKKRQKRKPLKKRSQSQAVSRNTKTVEKIQGRTSIPDKVSSTNLTTSHNKKRIMKRLRPSTKNNNLMGKRTSYPGVPSNNNHALKKMSSLKVVELYHNSAVKGSDSDELTAKKSEMTKPPPPSAVEVPPLVIRPLNNNQKAYSEFYIDANNFKLNDQVPKAPRTEISYHSKNYTLPTIASRMKQVNKCYFNGFHFKTIPFCAASSTTPSHNIGINIQQFMNFIKTKQPMYTISPTLAHNIGLAAEKIQAQPLSSMVSTMASRISSRCPLSKSVMNYQHLQEMAKVVPEQTIHEADEDAVLDSPPVRTVVITGPSGDMEVKNQKVTVWTAHPSTVNDCTCVANKESVDLQQMVNKNRRRVPKVSKVAGKKVAPKPEKTEPTPSAYTNYNTKEKNLKILLTNLYTEFDLMNKNYEDLAKKVGTGEETKEMVKTLEVMEKELTSKEEEIQMVMALSKEVMALKEQVKSLKQRKGQEAALNVKKMGEFCNNEAAMHLTKLLRQIQHYQLHYCKKDDAVC